MRSRHACERPMRQLLHGLVLGACAMPAMALACAPTTHALVAAAAAPQAAAAVQAATPVEPPEGVRALQGISLGDTDTAISLAADGAALYARETNKLDGYAYCTQAIQLAEKGEFRESARAASKALHVALQTGNTDLLGKAYRDLAIAFSYGGQIQRAEQFANLALKYPGLEPDQVVGPANKVIGDVRARQGFHDEAIRHYEIALGSSPPNFRPLVEASLANALILSGDLLRGRSTLDAIAEPADARQRAQLQRTRGRLLLAEDKPAEALALYRQLAAAPADGDEDFYRAWALDGIAKSQVALGQDAEAAQALDEAIVVFDRARAQFRSDEFKMGLFSDLQAVFERAIGMHSKLGQADKAFDISERSRARALLDAVAGRAKLGEGAAVALDAQALRQSLRPDEVVVAYHALPDRLLAWVLSSDGVREVAFAEAIPRARLESLVNTFRYLLFPKQDYFPDGVTLDAGAKAAIDAYPVYRTPAQDVQVKALIDRHADAIGKLLLAPLGVPAGKRVIIVPHGALHFLPFQALRLDGQYLIERNPVAIAPSTSIAARLASAAPVIAPDPLIVGIRSGFPEGIASLPGAEAEAKEVAAHFAGTELLLNEAATKAAFESMAANRRILHLATHGIVDSLDPLHSAILFAGADEQSSFLSAKEVLGLNLGKASLVVLSACESGLGSVRNDDEILGFTRSFLGSGAGALVSSLWEVDDAATRKLMTTLYDSLARGISVQDAMRDAQLAVLRDRDAPQHASPKFWAPFNLIGNWRLQVGK